jgi:isoleucyl-tRNA synthetase
VEIGAAAALYESLASLGEDLKYVLLTSRAAVKRVDGGGVTVSVTASKHPKCDRCWHYRADVNAAGLCGRCESNLKGPGEARAHA